MVPSYILKVISGSGNNWCKVASHKAYESNVGNRGSKSTGVEKEQRVEGSSTLVKNVVRYTLVAGKPVLERNKSSPL